MTIAASQPTAASHRGDGSAARPRPDADPVGDQRRLSARPAAELEDGAAILVHSDDRSALLGC